MYRQGFGEETVAALFYATDKLSEGLTKAGRHGVYVCEVTILDYELEMVPKVQFMPDDLTPVFKEIKLKVLLYHSVSGYVPPTGRNDGTAF